METLREIAVTVTGPGGRTNKAEQPASPHLSQDFRGGRAGGADRLRDREAPGYRALRGSPALFAGKATPTLGHDVSRRGTTQT